MKVNKKSLVLCGLFCFLFLILFSACKKDKKAPPNKKPPVNRVNPKVPPSGNSKSPITSSSSPFSSSSGGGGYSAPAPRPPGPAPSFPSPQGPAPSIDTTVNPASVDPSGRVPSSAPSTPQANNSGVINPAPFPVTGKYIDCGEDGKVTVLVEEKDKADHVVTIKNFERKNKDDQNYDLIQNGGLKIPESKISITRKSDCIEIECNNNRYKMQFIDTASGEGNKVFPIITDHQKLEPPTSTGTECTDISQQGTNPSSGTNTDSLNSSQEQVIAQIPNQQIEIIFYTNAGPNGDYSYNACSRCKTFKEALDRIKNKSRVKVRTIDRYKNGNEFSTGSQMGASGILPWIFITEPGKGRKIYSLDQALMYVAGL